MDLARVPLYVRRLSNIVGIRRKKVFVIGFNKSGSVSLHYLFESLGLPSFHHERWRLQNDRWLMRQYDCFSDGEPNNLKLLDESFPRSQFILNVRELDSWLYSRLAHIEREKVSNPNFTASPTWDISEEVVKRWISFRNRYHLFVMEYFKDRKKDLLIVNYIRDPDAARKVCQFLGGQECTESPRKNVNPQLHRPASHVEIVEACYETLGVQHNDRKFDIYCPSLLTGGVPELEQFPCDTTLL